ncbi:endo-1,4-beta-xylanase [Pelagicoccus sp. SDUM812005]|uniref:endo-1,4-beta-xylanase n=1 Tax=Pelagicoccus sp. SDUM812005 TaxID=3041257 RepID=UPI00280ED0C0|nr:endo-1,4-beta-xylanase [Pelagicoccus sp. SDUM812005]MDQ8181803.1 endo-1,4-beta-xylanase [Pelagicoccus sp. SDUM812005]
MKSRILRFALSSAMALPALAADISHRKADLAVQVQSVSGVPLEGATVEIEMLNHAFRFGCAVEHHLVDPNSSNYDPTTVFNLQRFFNSATYGNIMKWTYYEARTDEQNLAIAALPKSLNAFDGPDKLRLRGHVTIWGAQYQVPTRVRNSTDPAYVNEQILQHIHDYHTTYKSAGIDNFDLYNEHLHERQQLIEKIISNGSVAEEAAIVAPWFNKAKDADPQAVLFLNDYNILNASWVPNHGAAREYKAFIDALRDAGGQIDGIGLQAHMDRYVSKEDLLARLDILAAPMEPTANHPNGLPGLPIEITELDINADATNASSPETQATLARNVLEAAFEHPAVIGLTIWGMNDSNHWRNNALLFDDSNPNDWQLKPSGQTYVDLVTRDWWEDHTGTSSASGDYAANTFKGTHRVTVTYQGESKTLTTHLDSDQTLVFDFEAEAADASSYESWLQFIEWNGAPSAREDDADHDGISNLMEFLSGSDPLVFNTWTPIQVLRDGPTGPVAMYSIRAARQNVSHYLSWSTNLKDWQALAALPENTPIPEIQDGVATYTIPLFTVLPEPGNNFYRFTLKEKE